MFMGKEKTASAIPLFFIIGTNSSDVGSPKALPGRITWQRHPDASNQAQGRNGSGQPAGLDLNN